AMIAASLPPSSSSIGVSRGAAAAITARPVAGPPVNEITSIPGCVTNACASSMPGADNTFTTPGGIAAANTAPNCNPATGTPTAVLPALNADASFIIITANGQLNGITSAATPYGSRCSRG